MFWNLQASKDWITIVTKSKPADYYFWLGPDGDLEAVSKEDFDKKQEEIRKEREDWLNVNVD